MLLPAEVDLILKEISCKHNLVLPGGSSSNKIVLTLLAEVLTLYMGLSTIDVGIFSLALIPKES